jgi:hypothetical protein
MRTFRFMTAIAAFVGMGVTLLVPVPNMVVAITLGRATAKPLKGEALMDHERRQRFRGDLPQGAPTPLSIGHHESVLGVTSCHRHCIVEC